MPKVILLDGQRFGRLIVSSRAPNSGSQNQIFWNCDCDCGRSTVVMSQSLRTGHTKSCGCGRADTKSGLIHGKSKTAEHNIWLGMIARCENPNVKVYPNYGGAGISVCARWRSGDGGVHPFECFLADLGLRPSSKHSLDRENPREGYKPGNVRWALPLVQANNKKRTRWVEYRGEKMSLCDAVRAAGSVIHYEAAAIRLKSGWTVERALETPSSRRPQREVAHASF